MNKLTVFYDHIRNACLQENKSFSEIAKQLVSVGISGVEIEYIELLGDEGLALSKQLLESGLPISSVYCHFHWETPGQGPEMTEVLNRLKELNIHTLLAIPGFILPGQTPQESRQNLLNPLKELCDMAPQYEVQIVMEDFDSSDSSFGNSEGVSWYLENIPKLGCAFDTGNFLYFGEDSLSVLPKFLNRITYLHCKDRSYDVVEGETPLTTSIGEKLYSSPVGLGIIHMTEILNDVLNSGYNGPLAIEHFGSTKQLDYMLESARYLNSLLKRGNK